MNLQKLDSRQIVAKLEKNKSRQFTEAAHAEMMRRFVAASEQNSKRIFWLTATIVGLTAINLALTFLNFLKV
jgi:hypothetical protein